MDLIYLSTAGALLLAMLGLVQVCTKLERPA